VLGQSYQNLHNIVANLNSVSGILLGVCRC
jgi:hypothetical protein